MTFIAKKKKKQSNNRRDKTKLSLNIATCCFNEIRISLSEIELCAALKQGAGYMDFSIPLNEVSVDVYHGKKTYSSWIYYLQVNLNKEGIIFLPDPVIIAVRIPTVMVTLS